MPESTITTKEIYERLIILESKLDPIHDRLISLEAKLDPIYMTDIRRIREFRFYVVILILLSMANIVLSVSNYAIP